MITVKCLECNTPFEAQRTSAKFCSANCRVKYNNKHDSQESVPSEERTQAIELPPKPIMVVAKNGNLSLKPSAESLKRMNDTIEKINKDFGAGSVMLLGDKPNNKIEVIPTGSLSLNAALGIGGFPKGRIVEIYGGEASGKTTIAISTMAQAQKMGGRCAFIDAEHAFDPSYAEALGVKIDDMYIVQPDYGEQGLEIADRLVLSGAYAVVVIDSVAALVPKAEIEGEMGDSKMGLHARLMSQALRKMTATISKTNTIVIFINQLREKIGIVYGSPYVTTGGNALKFYASVRLDVSKAGLLKDGDESFGNKVKVKVAKNKVAPPFKIAEFDILYGTGIDYYGEIIEAAVEKQVIQKSASWYSYNGAKLGQGREAIRELFKDNEDLFKEIETKTINLIQ
jgi:recombination protein RecA